MRWWPLALATALAAAVVVGVGWSGAEPVPALLGSLLVAALAAGLALGLDDPAADLLAALPSGAPARLLHRLAPLTAATTAAALVLDELVRRTSAPAGVGADAGGWSASTALDLRGPALLALVAAGVTAHAVVAVWRPDLAAAAGASMPIGWVVVAAVAPASGPAGAVARLWLDRPVVVIGGAAAFGALVVSGRMTAAHRAVAAHR